MEKALDITYYIHISAPTCPQRTGRKTCILIWCQQLRTCVNNTNRHSIEQALHQQHITPINTQNIGSDVVITAHRGVLKCTREGSAGQCHICGLCVSVGSRQAVIVVTRLELFCNKRRPVWSPAHLADCHSAHYNNMQLRDLWKSVFKIYTDPVSDIYCIITDL